MVSANESHAQQQDPPRLVVHVSRPLYRLLWFALWVTHALCSCYIGAAGWLYWYADRPYLTYFADLVAPQPQRHFRSAGSICVLLAALQLASCLEMVVLSLKSGRLVLSRGTSRGSVSRLDVAVVPAPSQSRLSYPSKAGRFLWWACFSRRGFLGIDSPFFEVIFIVREGIEVALQTYQAFQMSGRIAEPSLNAAFVALLVLNCWSTPLLQRTLHHRPAVARCVCLVADLGINACANMLIPWLILKPYVRAWDAEQFTYDVGLLYDDIWYTNMVMEHRMLFAASALDVLSKVVPHAKMLFCLIKIRSLLAESVETTLVVPLVEGPNEKDATKCHNDDTSKAETPPAWRPAVASAMDMRSHKARAVHLLFVAWGIVVLVVHGLAQGVTRPPVPGCKQVMHPWFVSSFVCATLEINCFRLDKSMTPSDVLDRLHPSTLLSVVFSHCDALEVPPAIQRFPNLVGVEIYNATLLSWAANAALDPSIHTSIAFLLLIHVSLPTLPVGLMGPLPETLTDVEFAFTNLTSLPEDLHERWHGMATFYFEFSQLRSFPRTLCHLPVYDLSLIGNAIETVPELTELSASVTSFYTLALSHNPLRALPESLAPDVSIAFLMLEDTKLDSPLPKWVEYHVQERVYLSGTACCLNVNGSTAVQTRPCGLETQAATCTERDPRGDGRYPWATMAPRRAP
ncbi:hypothetical protein PINS_up016539 [Pythium insidiosum]|nr:hypothetical protein PINS_up016539 [Pythium insidiosum]